MNKLSFLALAATLVSAPAFAQGGLMPMAPADYVKTAGASDLFERQSAQVVLETTNDPKVRTFAQNMLTAHAKSTQAVAAAAKRARVPVAEPMLMPTQAELLAQLRAENGQARDALYIAQQKAAHNQALSVQQAYAQAGGSMPLRRAAQQIAPVVQGHIAMLKKI